MPRITLTVQPLEAASFQRFGEVVEAAPGVAHHTINDGYAQRYDDLARIDTAAAGGRSRVAIFRALPRSLPLQLTMVERHRLGSQCFMPLSPQRFLVVVAAAGAPPGPEALHAFLAAPGQGINMRPGTWHHPLLALDAGGDFLVIDRVADAAADDDCDVHRFDATGTALWVDGLG